VSAVLIMALTPCVVGAALVAFVTVIAVLTRDKDRRKTAVAVLKILSRPVGPTDVDSPRDDHEA